MCQKQFRTNIIQVSSLAQVCSAGQVRWGTCATEATAHF